MQINELPESLISIDSLDKISKARKEAEAYIESLLTQKLNESKG